MARKKKSESIQTQPIITEPITQQPEPTSPTPLTIDQIVTHEQQYDETTLVTFEDGRFVHIFKKFNPTKITQTVFDYSKFISELVKQNISLEDDKALKLYILHIVLTFSTLGDSIPDNFEAKVRAFSYLIESEYVNKIVASFDPVEMEKAQNELIDMFQKTAMAINENPELRKQIEGQLGELVKGENVNGKVDDVDA